jgi:hypothetical protein
MKKLPNFWTRALGKSKGKHTTKHTHLSFPFIAGLLDGDGFILSYKHTCVYELVAHELDQDLLIQLQMQFGGRTLRVKNKLFGGY